MIRSEEVSRVELQLGPGRYEGYLRTSEGLAALPIGSRLDPDTGVFTWAPGVGFVGAYDLVFVRHDGDEAVARREVRIILAPKGSGSIGPQVVIDTPRSQQDVGQPFVLAGWAADLNAPEGTGIATLHAWAYPLAGGPPVFLGATAYGGARPDVAAVHGEQFEDSGFGLVRPGSCAGPLRSRGLRVEHRDGGLRAGSHRSCRHSTLIAGCRRPRRTRTAGRRRHDADVRLVRLEPNGGGCRLERQKSQRDDSPKAPDHSVAFRASGEPVVDLVA